MPPTPEQEAIITAENLAILATLRRDGTPQLTPINYAYKDGRFLISTTRDRAKYRNLKRDPKVSLCIVQAGGRPYVTVFGKARIEEDDVAPGTGEIVRRMGRDVPDNFEAGLRAQGRILIVVTPERCVP